LRENVLDIPADKCITTDHYNTPELENPHILDGQYNIAADHYDMADLENAHISDGQYDIVGDHYSHLHLKTHVDIDRI
jgi:hypothetical protein